MVPAPRALAASRPAALPSGWGSLRWRTWVDPGKLCAPADLGREEPRPREQKPRRAPCFLHGPPPLSPGSQQRAEGRVLHKEVTWNSYFRWSVGEETPQPWTQSDFTLVWGEAPQTLQRKPSSKKGQSPGRGCHPLVLPLTILSRKQRKQN